MRNLFLIKININRVGIFPLIIDISMKFPVTLIYVTALDKKKSYFLTKTYVVGTQKNSLNEMVLLSTPNICFN